MNEIKKQILEKLLEIVARFLVEADITTFDGGTVLADDEGNVTHTVQFKVYVFPEKPIK